MITYYICFECQKTPAWGKTPKFTNKCVIWSPTVRSTASAPWTPCFRPYFTLNWLYTVPVTNKVDRKMTIYCSALSSFTMVNQLPNAWYFSAPLLPLHEIYVFFYVTQINVFFVRSKVNYDSKNPNNFVMRIISILFLIRSEKICDRWVEFCYLPYVAWFIGWFMWMM